MNALTVASIVVFVAADICAAQGQDPGASESPRIQDNSFLIEEAYNQEESVVQHISNFSHAISPERSWFSLFTQEWPLAGQTHQLSYAIPYQFIDATNARGFGDIVINYRYQLLADDDRGWIAPRFSVILPTGSRTKGLGSGSAGLQAALPVSKEVSGAVVVHGNLGGTVVFSSPAAVSCFAGASVIWQPAATVNLVLEGLASSNATVDDAGTIIRETGVVLNPGLRCALNFPRLQIVPGIAAPITFSGSQTATSVFFYLSFEHPY